MQQGLCTSIFCHNLGGAASVQGAAKTDFQSIGVDPQPQGVACSSHALLNTDAKHSVSPQTLPKTVVQTLL